MCRQKILSVGYHGKVTVIGYSHEGKTKARFLVLKGLLGLDKSTLLRTYKRIASNRGKHYT